MRSAFISCILLLFTLSACRNKPEPAEEHFKYEEIKTVNREIREVIYSMYLPTDLANLFSDAGTNYDPTVPAPISDITMYNNPEQIALMLGIYGVDLTYMKLLGQTIAAAQYYKIIETLSEKIGMPEAIFEKSSRQLERYINNEDSLNAVIDNIYRETDYHFRNNGQDNLAALTLTGGWVEAMYIGIEIFKADSGNHTMAENLLQQKYSLNSLYTILSNHQESLKVKEYLLMLKKLRKVYEKVEIMYQKEGFSVDTSSKKIQTYNSLIRYNEQTITDLVKTIPLIRETMITSTE
ncbi:MAG: hypothetical protein WD577_04595 [Bacteroidales bacterium]